MDEQELRGVHDPFLANRHEISGSLRIAVGRRIAVSVLRANIVSETSSGQLV